jgi:hypothetical protein
MPQNSISGLENSLNAKAEKSQLDAHKTDANAHTELFEDKLDKEAFHDHKTNTTAHADLFYTKENLAN